MVLKSREGLIGAWAFLAGVVLAVIVGLIAGGQPNPWFLLVLLALGLITGYFVSQENSRTFLLASIAVVIASFAGIQGFAADIALRGVSISGVEIVKNAISILVALLFLFIPATIIVALKTVFSLAKR